MVFLRNRSKIFPAVRFAALFLLIALTVALPAFAASDGSDPLREIAESENVLGNYATDSINGVLGAYALVPLDPMFNLAILSGIALLSHGGVDVNPSIQSAIDANVLLSNQVVCWILFSACILIGIAHLVLKYVPGISAATEAAITKLIDGLGVVVRFTPYLILIMPVVAPAAAFAAPNAFASAVSAGGRWLWGVFMLFAGIAQYLVIKFARAFLDLLVALSPEPFTTTAAEVVKKLFSAVMWVLALYAPEVLIVINVIVFLFSLILARKGYLLTKYCRGLFWRSFKHTLLILRGTATPEIYAPLSPSAPAYVKRSFPAAKRILKAYAASGLGSFPKKAPKYMAGWLLDTGNGIVFAGKSFHLIRRTIPLTGRFTLITRWDKCQIQVDGADGKLRRVDLSTHYAPVLSEMAREYGWRNQTEEKNRKKEQRKLMKEQKKALKKQAKLQGASGAYLPGK